MTEPVSSQHVLISGASSGIGRHCALSLADAGFTVLAAVRSKSAYAEIEAMGKDRLRPVYLDIASESSISRLAKELADIELYGLVNNAGTAVLGPIECLPLDQIREEFEVNLFGHIALIQKFLPKLRASRGRIINISSISGFIGFPGFGAYAASKFALEGLSDALRRELKATGVRVSVVQPGNIDTEIWQKSFTQGQALQGAHNPEQVETYGMRFASDKNGNYGPKRKSSPDLVARAVVDAMLSRKPKCRYVVGKDAKRLHRLRSLLPDRILDRFV